jgi:aspartyl protease family protein
MGHVYVDLEIENPEKPGSLIRHKALIDTGATYTVIPRDVCNKLGLKIEGSKAVKTALGSDVLDMSYSRIRINGKSGVSTILVSDKLDQILVGVVTLEILGLTIDPTTGQLNEAEALLL